MQSPKFGDLPGIEVKDMQAVAAVPNAASCVVSSTKITCTLTKAAVNALVPGANLHNQFRVGLAPITYTNNNGQVRVCVGCV